MTSAPPRPTIPALADIDLVIETERLALRPWTVEDADVAAMWRYARDPELPRNMSWAAHADESETRAWLERTVAERQAGRSVAWAICERGEPIGAISLDGIRWQFQAWRMDRAEVGYWLGPPHHGRGLMTEAALGVVGFAFERLGLHKLTIGCLERNVASRRVIEKVGFRYIGRLDDDVWRDGAWLAHLRFELLAAQWSDVATTMPLSRPGRP